MTKSENNTREVINNQSFFQIIKYTVLFLILGWNSNGFAENAKEEYSQSKLLSLKIENKSIREVFSEIESKSEFIFFYYDNILDINKNVSIDVQNQTINVILDQLFRNSNNTYTITDRQIYIKQKSTPGTAPQEDKKTYRITGIVKDGANGEALVGVNIRIKSRPQTGTATDINGKYLIDVLSSDVLEFAYIGYITQDIPVKGKTTIDVTMNENDQVLDEVTVVGYGTQKKISIIGSQQSISAADMKVPVANLTNSLGGRIAGLVSVQRKDEPGFDDSNIYIRGISTLTASMSAPLTLVDGVPRSFSNVDPEDIESFSILKDASATAIYGVRGANGVIIINTKSGRAGKPQFNIRYTEGFTHFTAHPEFVDAPTYMDLSNEALVTRGNPRQYSDDEIRMTRNGEDPYLYPNVDWFSTLFNNFGHNRTANANIHGGSDKATYYIGLGYYDETGLYKMSKTHDYNANTYYTRYNVTSNVTLLPTRTTEIKLGIQGYMAHANYPATGSETIFGKAFYMTPNYVAPVYPDGKIGDRPSSGVDNPYALLNETGYANQWRSQIFSNLRLTQDLPFIIKGLSVTGMFSFDAYSYTSNRFTRTPDTYIATGRDKNGNLIYTQTYTGTQTLSYSNNSEGNRSIYLEAALNYKRQFGLHDVTGMLLFNQSDELNTKASSVEEALPYRFRGLAGRFTYSYGGRYFGEFNFGYNGSENFAPDKRFGFFPSFGAGWVISNEKFFKPLSSVIQYLKLRGTWGKVGNAKITGRRFAYLATVDASTTTSYIFGKDMNQKYATKAIGDYNVDVTWETANKTNIGLDIMTLNNKLNVQIDIFKEQREGIFLSRGSIPAYVGMIKTPLGNIGKVDNKGIETSFTYNNTWKNWSLSAMGNFSFNRNKVIENDMVYPYPWLDRRGQKVGQRYGYIALGLFESDEDVIASPIQSGDTRAGDIKYKDLNGDGKINENDKAPIGWGAVPEIIYGFGFTLAYKNMSLSTMFQGATHVDVQLSGEGVMPFSQGLSRGNLLSNITNRWTESNPSQDVFYPRLMPGNLNMNFESSTWWLKSANYLRLKNIQLTYGLPKNFLKKINLNGANIFLQGVNVFTITPFKLWDVEKGDGRGDNYPNIASYNIGINFNF